MVEKKETMKSRKQQKIKEKKSFQKQEKQTQTGKEIKVQVPIGQGGHNGWG